MSGDDDIPQLVDAEVPSNEESDEVSCSRESFMQAGGPQFRALTVCNSRSSSYSSTVPLVSSECMRMLHLVCAVCPDLCLLSSLGTTYSW